METKRAGAGHNTTRARRAPRKDQPTDVSLDLPSRKRQQWARRTQQKWKAGPSPPTTSPSTPLRVTLTVVKRELPISIRCMYTYDCQCKSLLWAGRGKKNLLTAGRLDGLGRIGTPQLAQSCALPAAPAIPQRQTAPDCTKLRRCAFPVLYCQDCQDLDGAV